MNVEITGRHIVITDAIRDYILRKLNKLSRTLGDELNVHVVLEVEKERHLAEILLKSKLLNLTVQGETRDLYSTITRAVEKLERQALKRKSKRIESKRHIAKASALARKSEVPGDSSTEKPDGILVEEIQKKPMEVEEAVMELSESDYPFVVFRNVESGLLNVLYRRRDGSLALICG